MLDRITDDAGEEPPARVFGTELGEVMKEFGEARGEGLSLRQVEALNTERRHEYAADGGKKGSEAKKPLSYDHTTVRRYRSGDGIAPEDFIDLLVWIGNRLSTPLSGKRVAKLRGLRQEALKASANPAHRLENALFELEEADLTMGSLRKDLAAATARTAEAEQTLHAVHDRVVAMSASLDANSAADAEDRRTLLDELGHLGAELDRHRAEFDRSLTHQARLSAQLASLRAVTADQQRKLAAAVRSATEMEADQQRAAAEARAAHSLVAELRQRLHTTELQVAEHTGVRARAVKALAQVATLAVLTCAAAAGLWSASWWEGVILPQPAGQRILALVVTATVATFVGTVLGALVTAVAIGGFGFLWSVLRNREPYGRAPVAARVARGTGLAVSAVLAVAGVAAGLVWMAVLSLRLGVWVAGQAGLDIEVSGTWQAAAANLSALFAEWLCAVMLGLTTPAQEENDDIKDPTLVRASRHRKRWALGPFYHEEVSSFTERRSPEALIFPLLERQGEDPDAPKQPTGP
ncbi:hypothetical protein GCM10010415_65110 [Streptomyces atrovirens]